jgi:hypothetical protein
MHEGLFRATGRQSYKSTGIQAFTHGPFAGHRMNCLCA